jgi:hypothetical protein
MFLAVLVVVACVLASAAPAMAAHDTSTAMTFEGKTFPSPDGKIYVLATRTPSLGLTAGGTVDGFLYTVSRSPGTVPLLPQDPTEPPTAWLPLDWSGSSGGEPIATGILNLDSWKTSQTATPLPIPPPIGAPGIIKDDIEGWWFVTARSVIASETPSYSSSVAQGWFVIDVTPPAAPTGVKPVVGSAGSWSPNTRRDIQWDNPLGAHTPQYDALSGDSRYRLTLNGVETVVTKSVEDLPVNYCSFEDLPAGASVVGVSVVDYAGNVGSETKITLLTDPDAPTISIKAPANSGRYVMVESFVDELGGVRKIDYYVDGQFAMSSTAATVQTYDSWRGYYDFPSLDMARFRAGTHSVKAVVTDMVGRTATSNTVSVKVWDVTVPTVSRPSCGPNPFYPIKLDGYRDSTKITFRLSERAYVKLQIFDYSGEMVRELGSWRRAGKNTIVWSGQQKDKSKVAGRYTFRIVANDGKYNISTSSTGIVQLRSFYLKRISRSRVRAVYS